MTRPVRLTRRVHAGAWWAWAVCLAAAATRTTNPLLLAMLIAVAGFVVAARRPPHNRATFALFARLGVVVLISRVVFGALFDGTFRGHLLVRLPSIPLPSALGGLRIGGALSTETLVIALYGGCQLATLIVCVGTANALADARRLLRSLPAALYEVGVAVTVALSFAPQIVLASTRIRHARRLRGATSSGLRAWAGAALPLLQDALESSVELAAAMDSRGFGRRGATSRLRQRATSSAVIVGLLSVAAASYGLLTPGSPGVLGLPLLVGGGLIAAIALVVGGHHVHRTTYRPDPWRAPEWCVVATGLCALAGVVIAGHVQPGSLEPAPYPFQVPAVPWPAVVGLLAALAPAWLTPPHPRGAERITARPASASMAGASP